MYARFVVLRSRGLVKVSAKVKSAYVHIAKLKVFPLEKSFTLKALPDFWMLPWQYFIVNMKPDLYRYIKNN